MSLQKILKKYSNFNAPARGFSFLTTTLIRSKVMFYRTVIYTNRELDLYRDAPNGCFYTNLKAATDHADYLKGRGLDADVLEVYPAEQF
jgi:hypothetical protein